MALTRLGSTAITSLPAVSGANLTNLPAANLTGTLPAISGASLTGVDGNWVRLAANVLTSDASSMSTDSVFTTTYTHYKLIGNFHVQTNGAEINFVYRVGGSDKTASYYYCLRLFDDDGGNHEIYDRNASNGRVWNDIYHDTDDLVGGVGIDMSIFNVKKKDTLNSSDVTPGTNARPHLFFTGTGYNNANGKYTAGYGQIRLNESLAHGSNVDGLKFLASTGNIMAGSYYMIYGLEDS